MRNDWNDWNAHVQLVWLQPVAEAVEGAKELWCFAADGESKVSADERAPARGRTLVIRFMETKSIQKANIFNREREYNEHSYKKDGIHIYMFQSFFYSPPLFYIIYLYQSVCCMFYPWYRLHLPVVTSQMLKFSQNAF